MKNALKNKRMFSFFMSFVVIFLLVGCTNSEGNGSEEEVLNLTLGHNMNEAHTVSTALMSFVQKVEERTDGKVKITVFPNGQLGSETEMLEQLQSGVLDMVKVASPGMANYDDAYHAFGLPFLYDDQDHFNRVMTSPEMEDFFLSSEDKGFVGLTYYTSGQRSFYTEDKAIRVPEDLKGLNIRVQDMRTQTDMVRAMGGTPVAMAYGEVYTALQTGIIDGTENNETALTVGQHGEVAKFYSYTEHAIIPDVLVMSERTWSKLSPSNQEIFLQAARESTEEHTVLWNEAVQAAIEEAKNEMGVTFVTDVDKDAFRKATEPIVDKYMDEYKDIEKVVNIIRSID